MVFNKIEKTLLSLLIFSGVFFLTVARRPDIIFQAQPWAEDGTVWLSDAYNNGIFSSLLHPQNGYYQTVSRVAYGIGLFFGVSKAAIVANMMAVSIRCFFVMFVLSKRFSFVDIKYRVAAALYFIVMPNVSEGFANITNIHWYLSIYLMAIIIANKPEGKKWRLHDLLVLFVSSLSGPFIIFIAVSMLVKKIFVYKSFSRIFKSITVFDVCAGFLFVIQFLSILMNSAGDRSSAPLGANFDTLCDIIVYRVIGGTFVPSEYIHFLSLGGMFNEFIFVAVSLLIIFTFFMRGWRFKVVSVFVLLMIGFALAKPMMSMDSPQWPIFLMPNTGERYFIVTNFSFFCMILFFINEIDKKTYIVLMTLLILIMPPLLKGFNIPPVEQVGFKEDLLMFNNSDQGSLTKIRIAPQGWYMVLKKK